MWALKNRSHICDILSLNVFYDLAAIILTILILVIYSFARIEIHNDYMVCFVSNVYDFHNAYVFKFIFVDCIHGIWYISTNGFLL